LQASWAIKATRGRSTCSEDIAMFRSIAAP
jgi:hypothetical protein